MGHQSSAISETNRLYQMPLGQYILKQRINSALSVWRNRSAPYQQLIQCKMVVNSPKDLTQIYDIFKMRHTHIFLVPTRYLTCEHQGIKGCGDYYKGNIYFQSSIATLSLINDIPFADSLHLYSVALKGFAIMYNKFGYFDVFQDMFHICENGRAKVWCNSQSYKLQPQSYLLDANGKQEDMIYRIINIIDQNTDKTQNSNMKQIMYSYLPPQTHFTTFEQANSVFKQVCKDRGWQPPQRLKCIAHFTKEDIEKLIYQQAKLQNNHKQQHTTQNMMTINTLENLTSNKQVANQGKTSIRVPEQEVQQWYREQPKIIDKVQYNPSIAELNSQRPLSNINYIQSPHRPNIISMPVINYPPLPPQPNFLTLRNNQSPARINLNTVNIRPSINRVSERVYSVDKQHVHVSSNKSNTNISTTNPSINTLQRVQSYTNFNTKPPLPTEPLANPVQQQQQSNKLKQQRVNTLAVPPKLSPRPTTSHNKPIININVRTPYNNQSHVKYPLIVNNVSQLNNNKTTNIQYKPQKRQQQIEIQSKQQPQNNINTKYKQQQNQNIVIQHVPFSYSISHNSNLKQQPVTHQQQSNHIHNTVQYNKQPVQCTSQFIKAKDNNQYQHELKQQRQKQKDRTAEIFRRFNQAHSQHHQHNSNSNSNNNNNGSLNLSLNANSRSQDNKIIKSIIIPDSSRNTNRSKVIQVYNGKQDNANHKQSQRDNVSQNKFDERFEQSMQPHEPLNYVKSNNNNNFGVSTTYHPSSTSYSTHSFPQSRPYSYQPTYSTSTTSQYTDPKLFELLSIDHQSITINPTFNFTLKQQAFNYNHSNSNNNSNKRKDRVKEQVLNNNKRQSPTNNKFNTQNFKSSDQLYFSFSGAKQPTRQLNTNNKTGVRFEDNVRQINEYVINVESSNQKIDKNEPISQFQLTNNMQKTARFQPPARTTSTSKKKYQANMDSQIWNDLQQLRKNRQFR